METSDGLRFEYGDHGDVTIRDEAGTIVGRAERMSATHPAAPVAASFDAVEEGSLAGEAIREKVEQAVDPAARIRKMIENPLNLGSSLPEIDITELVDRYLASERDDQEARQIMMRIQLVTAMHDKRVVKAVYRPKGSGDDVS